MQTGLIEKKLRERESLRHDDEDVNSPDIDE